MNDKKIDAAAREARRFLAKIDDLRGAKINGCSVYPPKESGSLKRSSMDLTRALADLRRSGD